MDLRLNTEALTLARESGDLRAVGIIKGNQAVSLIEEGKDERAAALLSEALEALQAVGDTYGLAWIHRDRAMIALRRQDAESAAADLRDALRLSRSIGDTQTIAHILAVAVAAAFALGDPRAAATLAAADEVLCAAHRFDLGSLEREFVERSTQSARRELGDEFERAWAAGAELDVGAAVELAMNTLGS
jgi:hypothetical protein